MRVFKLVFHTIPFLCITGSLAFAGEVKIEEVVANQVSDNSYRFAVTLRHDDTGWDHYANEWQVLDGHGNILGTRVLAHPHVNEQPFTRSSSPIEIPENLKMVYIRAKDNMHGWAINKYELKIR